MKSDSLDLFIAAKNNGTLQTILTPDCPDWQFFSGTIGLDEVDKAALVDYIKGDEDHIHQMGFAIPNSEGILVPKFWLILGCAGYSTVCNQFVDEMANSVAGMLGGGQMPPLFGEN